MNRNLVVIWGVGGGLAGLLVGVGLGVLVNSIDDPASPPRTTIIEVGSTAPESTTIPITPTSTDPPIATPITSP